MFLLHRIQVRRDCRNNNRQTWQNSLENDGPNVVKLLIYDMTKGNVRAFQKTIDSSYDPLSLILQVFRGNRVNGLWHAGVYVFGKEWGYSPQGVKEYSQMEGRDYLDYPEKIEIIGETSISMREFEDFLEELSTGLFRACDYYFPRHNCIIFAQVLCKFLCGESIPKYLLEFPTTVMEKPLIKAALKITMLDIVADSIKYSYTVADHIENVPASKIRKSLRDLHKQQQENHF